MSFNNNLDIVLNISNNATPGPWKLDKTVVNGLIYSINGVSSETSVATEHSHGVKSYSYLVATPALGHSATVGSEAHSNMEFIAISRSLVPKLVQAIQETQNVLAGLKQESKGLIYAHEFALAADGGNSNMAVLSYWIERAEETLKRLDSIKV